MRAPALPLAAACLLGAATLPAQFLNRATWLGPEDEDVRRNFRQGNEYYLDRFGYVTLPPWWDRGLRRFGDGFAYRVGSTSTSQFTVEGQLDHGVALGDGLGFRYHFLQSENRDTRFVRNAFELEYGLGEPTAVFVQTEMLAEKSLIDASAGVWLFRRESEALRLMVTAVDAPSAKSREFEFEQNPYALMASGAFGDPAAARVAFEVGGQLPFEIRDFATAESLWLHRWIGSVETHLPLGGRDWLVAAGEAEWTWKELRPDAVGDPATEDFRRDFRQLRLEWWRDGERPWSVGVLHTGLREDGLRPFDPAEDQRVRRDEWFGIARLQLPLDSDGRWQFEPQAFAGHVRTRFLDQGEDRRHDRFEGKVAWNVRWDVSARATLAVSVTTQLDELAFGGGGAQVAVRF